MGEKLEKLDFNEIVVSSLGVKLGEAIIDPCTGKMLHSANVWIRPGAQDVDRILRLSCGPNCAMFPVCAQYGWIVSFHDVSRSVNVAGFFDRWIELYGSESEEKT